MGELINFGSPPVPRRRPAMSRAAAPELKPQRTVAAAAGGGGEGRQATGAAKAFVARRSNTRLAAKRAAEVPSKRGRGPSARSGAVATPKVSVADKGFDERIE